MDTPGRKSEDLICFGGGPWDGSVLSVPAGAREILGKQFAVSPCTHVYTVVSEDDGSRFLRYAGEVCPVDG